MKYAPILALAIIISQPATSQTSVISGAGEPPQAKYLSLRYEIERAIQRGNHYLATKQQDGIWSTADIPAMTALPLTAYLRSPLSEGEWPDYIKKAFQFILQSQNEDGSIYNRGLASYNTSVCMMALLAANREEHIPALLKARAFLVQQQSHFAPDSPYHGGIGYGDQNSPPIADLSNSSMAYEALYYSKQLAQDGKYGQQPDLDWDAAIAFVSRCQDVGSPDKGGFMYRPAPPSHAASPDKPGPASDNRQAPPADQTTKRPNGKKPGKRGEQQPGGAYGSMTYAGIQSLIYADLKKDDPRIQMALQWLQSHYTLEENPGVGLQGLYYYYQAMSKTMSALNLDTLTLADGTKIDWRDQLAQKLISLQREDGSWANTNNRWWEADPVLVTAYCVLALEQLYHSIPIEKK